ncbi:hypothetical protein [Mucilaginibacter jinjuensis]|uniref:Uncharacterized protein n=1 Tax=Mucilaginibacter jinjuensis TaxID=1176721 RepID=A0ABY7T4F3_9SPHI|nr:hypothetical protein [Mucilaginibacter jinjuensis]WCT10641.1 hypothetical protein PQO05_18040 [Mucilaginibacter jinjuensis]
MSRSVLLKTVLLLLSIYMLLVSPIITALRGDARHLPVNTTEHKHHISPAYIHANSWGLISNYHFTTPPVKLTLKDLAVILCCAGFLLFTTSKHFTTFNKWLYRHLKVPNSDNLYLRIRTLLI